MLGDADGFTNFDGSHHSIEASLAQARAGSEAAIVRLLSIYRNYLLTVANRGMSKKLRAKEAASDVVAKTEQAAHLAFADFRGATEPELRSWLLSILSNNMQNVRRAFDTKARDLDREFSIEELSSRGIPAQSLPSREESPSARLHDFERATAVSAALDKLPEHYRRTIQMKYWERLEYEQIGEKLGVSAEAARKLWARAIAQLRNHLRASNSESR